MICCKVNLHWDVSHSSCESSKSKIMMAQLGSFAGSSKPSGAAALMNWRLGAAVAYCQDGFNIIGAHEISERAYHTLLQRLTSLPSEGD